MRLSQRPAAASLLSALLLLLAAAAGEAASASASASAAPVPRSAVRVEALQQGGLRIGVQDVRGADLVVINADINVPLEVKDTGKISKTALEAKNGLWAIYEPDIKLKVGDVVFYWVYLSVEGEGSRQTGREVITGFVDETCEFTATTVNGKGACAGQLIFEDNFDSLNPSWWKHALQVAGDPDFDFCTYVNSSENSFAVDGMLHLKPTLLDPDDLLTPIKTEGCTWEHYRVKDYCEFNPVSWNIAPPTHSAWLRTKGTFSFKYGRVVFRARPAGGDWLFSRLFLEPLKPIYGHFPHDSGRMSLTVRGNHELKTRGGTEEGAARLNGMSSVATCYRLLRFGHDHDLPPGERYTDKMREYAISWSPREVRYEVDGETFHTVTAPVGGFRRDSFFSENCNSPWDKGSAAAPFDHEFYLNLALQVGGFNRFADDSISSGEHKPWSEWDPRAKLTFWKDKSKWFPTWKTDFEIDYVKVTAL